MKNALKLLLGALVVMFADVNGEQKKDSKVTENSADISKVDKLVDEFELISKKIKEGGLSYAELNDLEKKLNILEREYVAIPLEGGASDYDFLSQMGSLLKQAKDLIVLQKSEGLKEEEFHAKVVKIDDTIDDSTIGATKENPAPTTMSIEDLDEGEDFIPTAKKVEGPIDYSPQKVSKSKRKVHSAQELLQDIDLVIKMRKGRGEEVSQEIVEIFKALSVNIDEFLKGNKINELDEICARLNVLRNQNTPEKEIAKLEHKVVIEIRRKLSTNISERLNAGTPLDEMARKSESVAEGASSFHRKATKVPRRGEWVREKTKQFGEKIRQFGGKIKEKLRLNRK